MSSTTAAGAIPLLYLVNLKSPTAGSVGLAAFVGGALTSVTGSNVRAVLIGVNPPEARGTAFAVFSLFDSLGKGLGPAAVAGIIASRGRRSAFNISICLWFVCALLLGAMAVYLEADEKAMVDKVEEARRRNAAGREMAEEGAEERGREGGDEAGRWGAEADTAPLLGRPP